MLTPYVHRAVACNGKGDDGNAIAESIRLYPDTHTARGNAYYGKGDYDQAIADFEQAIRLDPKNPVAYCNRGKPYGKAITTGWLPTSNRP